jgi:hypothetical protein
VVLCRNLGLFSEVLVAIDGSKFKAVNGRDRNFTEHKLKAWMQRPKALAYNLKRAMQIFGVVPLMKTITA